MSDFKSTKEIFEYLGNGGVIINIPENEEVSFCPDGSIDDYFSYEDPSEWKKKKERKLAWRRRYRDVDCGQLWKVTAHYYTDSGNWGDDIKHGKPIDLETGEEVSDE